MISFHVPLKVEEEGGGFKEFFSFPLQKGSSLLLAGSRHHRLPDQLCRDIVSGFGRLGFSFILGCANGVDASFRSALAESDYKDQSFVAVCYPYRVPKITDLPAELVIPDSIHPRQAPRVRTLHMVDRSDMAIVFADDPTACKSGATTWGKGSTLAINACIKQSKPVFVVTSHKPDEIDGSHILPTSLFGAVRGYFIVPKSSGVFTCPDSIKGKSSSKEAVA